MSGAHSAASESRRSPRSRARPTRLDRTARAAEGKARRGLVPLESHAELVTDGRPDPIALLESQAASRVAELVPIRYGRMSASAFAFYRGGALIMAHDLARGENSGLTVQLCGDAHLSNFGFFATPERKLIFDVNDFDETYPGPFEWDVKRLAASMAVAARSSEFSAKKCRKVVLATVTSYREAMRRFAAEGNLAVWYTHVDVDEVLARIGRRFDTSRAAKARKTTEKARSRDNLQALSKLTTVVDGRARIISQPPLLVPVEELYGEDTSEQIYDSLRRLVASYSRTLQRDRKHLLEQFELVQLARKVVGVGSVGTRAWILLFEGLDGGDPLFLQAKEAQQSVLAGYLKASQIRNQGERVVNGQRLMQSASDIFLGWQRAAGPDGVQRDFYIRQLRDGKGSVVVEQLLPEGMEFYGQLCGSTLAQAHARSGDRVAIAAYLGSSDRFDRAVADFAESYADQNMRDHAALLDAVASDRVSAQTGI